MVFYFLLSIEDISGDLMDKVQCEYVSAVDEYLSGVRKVIETHMSWVFLGKHEAVKVFKPIDLFFVDMRPLLKRKVACVKTAQIDKVYSPDLNTRVATVVLLDGKYSLACGVADECRGGKVVDYVIVMRRFGAQNELREFYVRGKFRKEYGSQIGELLADAHKRANRSDEISKVGFCAIQGNFDEAFGITKKYIGVTISEDDYNCIFRCYRRFVESMKGYMMSRRDSGFIRQCHGDAHSGNMFVEDGKVKIFDCIGFKDEFSYMDVVSDVAFACMDAVFYGRRDVCDIIRDTYVEKTKDYEGVEKLLDFYIAYRAFVRGEVTTMAALGWRGHEREKMIKRARKYFGISKEYALKCGSPNVFLVVGYVASGKSTVADELCKVMGACIVRTDEIRREIFPLVFDYSKVDFSKRLSQGKIREWIDANDKDKIDFQQVLNPLMELKDDGYREIVREYRHNICVQRDKVYDACFERVEKFLLRGEDVIFDATFSRREMRMRVYDVLRRRGVDDVYIVQVVCGLDAVKRRLLKRMGGMSNARQVEIYDIVKREFDESRIDLDNPEGISVRRVVYHSDTGEVEVIGKRDDTLDMIVNEVIGVLRKRYLRS